MGRKSSAKRQGSSSGETPSDTHKSTSMPMLVGVVVLAALIVGVLAFRGGNAADPTAQTGPRPVADVPAAAKLGPHPQEILPPLTLPGYQLSRSPEVIRAAYKFAAEHPEVASYVPCFCGCDRQGHRGNEDCFVAARDANGDVVEWNEHGYECAVCLDVATRSAQMFSSGASVSDIRAAVDAEWTGRDTYRTPTPMPD
jgi:Protein of unknown function with PCYCGC motif